MNIRIYTYIYIICVMPFYYMRTLDPLGKQQLTSALPLKAAAVGSARFWASDSA